MSSSAYNRGRHRVATSEARFEVGIGTTRVHRSVIVRSFAIAFLGLVVIALPLGPLNRRLAAGALIFLVSPMPLLATAKLSDPDSDTAEVSVHIAILAIATVLLPTTWAASLVILGMLLVGNASVQRGPVVVTLAAVSIATFSVIGWQVGPTRWYAPLIAMGVLMASISFYNNARSQRIEESSRRYDALIGDAAVFFWEADVATGEFTAVAGNSYALVGYHPGEIIAMQWEDLVEADDRDAVRNVGLSAVDGRLSTISGIRHRDGSTRQFRHLMTYDRETGLMQGVSSNIDELAEANRLLTLQAETDELTGLANRSVLVARLDAALARTGDALALLVLDLDRFKEVNDTLGHPVGDELLRTLAERFCATELGAEVVARLGGDEFAVLLTEGVDRHHADRVARRIVESTEERMVINGVTLSISPSIGIVLAPEHGTTAQTLLQRADIAMYEAKRSNDSYKFFEATPEELSLERLELGAAVGPALDEGQIELWYQPKVDLATGRVTGAEGLARWHHLERGVLAPDQFLELIEISGEFHRFTDGVIRDGIAMAAECSALGCDLAIAVNVASSSFFDQDLPGRIHGLLVKHRVRPEQLMLEITESDILDEVGVHVPVFDRLAELGVGLSIDDFGTGYSSLTRLRSLPVTELKIDRSFIKRVRDEEDRIIVKAVIDLALLLGHRTVAEGVEDQATADMLANFGCDEAQGFLWAKPMPRAEFVEFLRTWPGGVGHSLFDGDLASNGGLVRE